MAELRVRVDAELAAALATEADRLGFDSRGAYVRWLLDRRQRLDADGETEPGEGPEPGAVGGRALVDGGVHAATSDEGGLAVSVTPGRVTRPDDEAVAEAAARLGDVERDRVDAMLRRAGGLARDERPGADLADLDALDLPGRDETLLERRRRLVGAGLAFLREAGEARRSEFVAALRDEHPAGYDSVAGWWRCLSEGLRQVDRVRAADADVRTWRFRDVRGRVHVSSDWE